MIPCIKPTLPHKLLRGDIMKPTWKQYVLWIALTETVGGISALLSRDGMKLYEAAVTQPPLAPPMWVFPVVWTILYALMAVSAARISTRPVSAATACGQKLFFTQLMFNFFWSIIFFNLQAYWPAFWWLLLLWIQVLAMILCYHKEDSTAARLQIPYLLWLTFAGYLNFWVARNN